MPRWDNDRHTVNQLIADARAAGYKVADPVYDDWAEEYFLTFDISGGPNNDLYEAYFKRSASGYWRFDKGFRHVGITGDYYRTLKAFRDNMFSRYEG